MNCFINFSFIFSAELSKRKKNPAIKKKGFQSWDQCSIICWRYKFKIIHSVIISSIGNHKTLSFYLNDICVAVGLKRIYKVFIYIYMYIYILMVPVIEGYWKWVQWPKFKSWMSCLHLIVLVALAKLSTQLFSLQCLLNSRAD